MEDAILSGVFFLVQRMHIFTHLYKLIKSVDLGAPTGFMMGNVFCHFIMHIYRSIKKEHI